MNVELASVDTLSTPMVPFSETELARATNALKALEDIKRQLLPTEDHTAINKKIEEISQRVYALEAHQIRKISPAATMLNTRMFTDRTEKGLPRHVPFSLTSLTSNVCKFSGNGRFYQTFPKSLQDYYGDVATHLVTYTRVPYWNLPRLKRTFRTSSAMALCALLLHIAFKLSVGVLWLPLLAAILSFAVVTLMGLKKHVFSVAVEREIEISFEGFFPSNIRDLIKRIRESTSAGSPLFKEVFILSDIDDSRDDGQHIFRKNHKLVAYDGKHFWLMALFNSTTLEEQLL